MAAPSCRAFRTRISISPTEEWLHGECDLYETTSSGRACRGDRRVRGSQSVGAVDRRRRLVDGRLRRPDADRRIPRRARPRSTGCASDEGRPHVLGQHARARARRDHAGHVRPGRRRDRSGRPGAPSGTLQETAMRLVQRLLPAPSEEEWERAILDAQRTLHALGITACQEASLDEALFAPYRSVAERGELTMRTEGNLLWSDDAGDEVIEELLEPSRERYGRAPADPGSEAVPGRRRREPHGRDARVVPRRRRLGNRGIGASLFEPERLRRIVADARCTRASRCTSMRSVTGRCESRWTRSRQPRRRTAGATRATISPTCSSSTLPTYRASASWASSRT